jgi:Ribonuclease HII
VGVDEVGRGPLAGPVVACAVILNKIKFNCRIDDSKKLSAAQRLKAFKEILDSSLVGTGIVSETVIDKINIHQATQLAMQQAIAELTRKLKRQNKSKLKKKVCVLIDGNSFSRKIPFEFLNIIKGDAKSKSIASASIVAKVTRDRIMDKYDKIYPQYGFIRHKGYGTKGIYGR